MTQLATEIRRGAYADSIVLMQLQGALAAEPGVADAGVVMATRANLDLLSANGLLTPEAEAAAPDDLVIVVAAESEDAASAALARVDRLMERRAADAGDDFRPRTLRSAVKLLPAARWVLVSVPGRYAASVAREALGRGRNVFLFSDNVSLDDEVALKREAAAAGRLVLGPDCGTAIVGGVGFGFANRVRRGAIGIVAASGTGLQAVAARIDALGAGVSHALGTGGRDLSEEVGALTARQALDLLARDRDTRAIVLVSKPPAPAVAARLLAAARAAGKPVVVWFLGQAPPARRLSNLRFAVDSTDAAELAVAAAERVVEKAGDEPPAGATTTGGDLRGLFAGGTLAYEAQLALASTLSPIRSNAPIGGSLPLADPARSEGHTIVDLGADELTVGRPHPMIDQDLRLRRLRREAADPATGVILLDLVLGDGAHPDPAAELAPEIERALGERPGLEVVVVVVGTAGDPQDLERQRELLEAAGARVCADVATAAARIAARLGPLPEPLARPADPACLEPPAALNVGVEAFWRSLTDQGAAAVQVDWRPPAGGDERLQALLAKLAG